MSGVVLVAAMDRARAIGRADALPWHLPADLRRFKALTLGRHVLMGRRTAASIGRALPGRDNLVLTRHGQAPFPGQRPVASVDEARALAGAAPLYVAGGGEVYALALPQATAMHLTLVDTLVEEADAWFPAWDPARWTVVAEQDHPADERHAHPFRFLDLVAAVR
ncbi:MAG: dihydrofolate reductase [Xanthomonadales bacterium]|nr:dihydrofolate reductase [Xanthomonadales bacterium]